MSEDFKVEFKPQLVQSHEMRVRKSIKYFCTNDNGSRPSSLQIPCRRDQMLLMVRKYLCIGSFRCNHDYKKSALWAFYLRRVPGFDYVPIMFC